MPATQGCDGASLVSLFDALRRRAKEHGGTVAAIDAVADHGLRPVSEVGHGANGRGKPCLITAWHFGNQVTHRE